MTISDATWEFRVGASRSASSAVDNLPWHGFGKIRGDERDIDDGKYGMDEVGVGFLQTDGRQGTGSEHTGCH